MEEGLEDRPTAVSQTAGVMGVVRTGVSPMAEAMMAESPMVERTGESAFRP